MSKKAFWDMEWTYDMGTLEDCGHTKTIVGNANATLYDEGLLLEATKSVNDTCYVRHLCPVNICLKGVVEALINIKSFSTVNGFRLLLSNGTKGSQICIINQMLYVLKGNETSSGELGYPVPTEGVRINTNTDYLIRMEFDINSGTKVWLDNVLICDMPSFSEIYCKSNSIFQQDGGRTVLKSLKYKFY